MIKIVKVKKQLQEKKEQDDKWLLQAPSSEDCDFILSDDESYRVEDENGNMVFTILRNSVPKDLGYEYYRAIKDGKAITRSDLRNIAAGIEVDRKNYVTRVSKRKTNTPRSYHFVESSIIGFYDRYPRINYCRKTSWVLNNPKLWEKVKGYTYHLNDLYKVNCPNEYKQHTSITNKTSPDFLIPGTGFTTITLNRNFRTHYHRDAGNLQEGFAAMSYIKRGKFKGGELVFPNYRVGVKLKNYDIIVFKNTEIHGNTEIIKSNKDADYERITSVFFYRKNMIYCGTAEEELERTKRNKGDQIIGPTTEDLNKGRFS